MWRKKILESYVIMSFLIGQNITGISMKSVVYEFSSKKIEQIFGYDINQILKGSLD